MLKRVQHDATYEMAGFAPLAGVPNGSIVLREETANGMVGVGFATVALGEGGLAVAVPEDPPTRSLKRFVAHFRRVVVRLSPFR
jgi:hypothetical protein